ncbi:MAG: GFA family protein [Burkholderiaceae bacterium]
MQLNGSCHCGAVHFTVHSSHPYPYQLCYCSICRKTQGGGGFAINLGGDATSMIVTGRDALSVYCAKIKNDDGTVTQSTAQRNFCKHCGSALWLFSPEYPELIHPFASAIDTALPVAPEHTHLLLDSKASWVPVHAETQDKQFQKYPEESIAQWHDRLGLTDDG